MVAERKCIDPNYFIEEPLDKKLPLPSGKLDNPLYKLQYKTSNIVAVIPIPKQCFFRMHSHAGKGCGTVHDQSKLIPNQCLMHSHAARVVMPIHDQRNTYQTNVSLCIAMLFRGTIHDQNNSNMVLES